MPSVLFICTANLYRSPLAAAFLRKKIREMPAGEEWNIDSAGTWTQSGSPVHSQTLEDARRFGLDVHKHRSKQVSADLLEDQDLILVMETGHKEALWIEFADQADRIHLLSEVVDGRTYDIPDPFSIEGNHDREVVKELDRMITRGFQNIVTLARKASNNKGKSPPLDSPK
jgi:protein-tyrosine phosphatase